MNMLFLCFLGPISMAIISNRLTRTLNIRHPIISAPMAFAGGGALAVAVSAAGGLGLIGGGYGDSAWLDEQFNICAGHRVGVGFITWSLRKSPSLLTDVLKRCPVAVMLSFGDPRPFVDEIRRAGALLICQCQNADHVWDAIGVGADIIVAQGAEAGGHGMLQWVRSRPSSSLRRSTSGANSRWSCARVSGARGGRFSERLLIFQSRRSTPRNASKTGRGNRRPRATAVERTSGSFSRPRSVECFTDLLPLITWKSVLMQVESTPRNSSVRR